MNNTESSRINALNNLRNHMSADSISSANRCYQRLLSEVSKPVEDITLLLAYGGGKDSSYTTAFVRLMQLMAWQLDGVSFHLRIITNRHTAMSSAVMENIYRAYSALAILDDPLVEALIVDGNTIRPFAVNLPYPEAERRRNRRDVLLHGHRFSTQARSMFCNACNLSMLNAFGLAAGYGRGVDAIITGDSQKERTAYIAWINQLARRFGSTVPSKPVNLTKLLGTMDSLSRLYYQAVYTNETAAEHGGVFSELPQEPLFFSIYTETEYDAGAHWSLLEDLLKFRFDSLMFSFSESDCGNPAIMSHLRGLRAELALGRNYREGLLEYVEFGLDLMRRKSFPAHLIRQMQKRFESEDDILSWRNQVTAYVEAAYELTERQLACMVQTPFADRGSRLRRWLESEASSLCKQERAIHRLLGRPHEQTYDLELASELEEASGLELGDLRSLYHASLVPDLLDPRAEGDPLALILRGDPHRAIITTRHGAEGRPVVEVISGR